jgi:hypothetical protein
MLKLWIFLLFFIVTIGQPSFAKNQSLSISTSLTFHSKPFLGLQNNLRSSDKVISKFNIKYDTDNSASQLALNYDEYNDLTFDRSYLQYTSGIATFGVGAIDRQWSFSDRTSLILSHNARPFKSIYLKLENKLEYDWLPTGSNWSLEIFNGYTKGSLNSSRSMLLGVRAIISPIEGLDFEIIQSSQWGGREYGNGISALTGALLLDTNISKNSNINKMAGFGISYTISDKRMPLRIYGQAIGEDEAGNLPSCFAYLAGLEWSNTQIKYPITLGIEAVDTRIDYTGNRNCGPNTMYNNNTYDYVNYGTTMGANIDTEGKSLEFFGQSQLSRKINIEYSTKLATINDKNWTNHRLSSKIQSGIINSLGASWNKNNVRFKGNIYFQGFNLEKANIKKGYGVNFSTAVKF